MEKEKSVDVSTNVKYIIKIFDVQYVKTGKFDTYHINEAKRFKSAKQAKNFITANSITDYKIIEVKDE